MKDWRDEREEILGTVGKTNTPFRHLTQAIINKARIGQGGKYSRRIIESNEGQYAFIGVNMELTNGMLKKMNDEVKESSQILKDLWNEMQKTNDLLQPGLIEIVKRIRQSRMTISTELQTALSVMRDVRKFFLESDYEKEMERLEKFVVLGERMKQLIEDGTMEAISDVILKLAIGEGSNGKDKG